MRTTSFMSALLLAALVGAGPASAQKLTKGTLSGTIASDTVRVPAGSTGYLFFDYPGFDPGISLIVTQACVTSAGCVTLEGEDFGLVPIEGTSGLQCQTYEPGINVGPDSLQCTNGCASAQSCTVTGVLTK